MQNIAAQRIVIIGNSGAGKSHLAQALAGQLALPVTELDDIFWLDGTDLMVGKLPVARSEWQGQIGTTKGNRMRMVPMTTRLAETLRKHRHLRFDRVLCGDDGMPIQANTLAYWVERATRTAGLATTRKPKGKGPHVLRHTFCSHLAMRGASAKAIQELAGHRDLATTQRYMHLSPSALDAAIALLEQQGTRGHYGDMCHTLELQGAVFAKSTFAANSVRDRRDSPYEQWCRLRDGGAATASRSDANRSPRAHSQRRVNELVGGKDPRASK